MQMILSKTGDKMLNFLLEDGWVDFHFHGGSGI